MGSHIVGPQNKPLPSPGFALTRHGGEGGRLGEGDGVYTAEIQRICLPASLPGSLAPAAQGEVLGHVV